MRRDDDDDDIELRSRTGVCFILPPGATVKAGQFIGFVGDQPASDKPRTVAHGREYKLRIGTLIDRGLSGAMAQKLWDVSSWAMLQSLEKYNDNELAEISRLHTEQATP